MKTIVNNYGFSKLIKVFDFVPLRYLYRLSANRKPRNWQIFYDNFTADRLTQNPYFQITKLQTDLSINILLYIFNLNKSYPV